MKASKKELEADFFRVGKKEKTMIYGFFILLQLQMTKKKNKG